MNVTSAVRVVGLLVALCVLAGCDLVLGIDDVSSANGPDSGQMLQGVSEDPDSGAAGRRAAVDSAADSGDSGDRDDWDAGAL